MRKRFASLLFLSLVLSNALSAQNTKIRVAVASSLIPAMQEIKEAFESTTDFNIELIPGASGTLANQILHGAPYKVFISANRKFSHILYENGRLVNKARDLVKGQLVLWSGKKINHWTVTNSDSTIANLLLHPETRTIAIAQPGLAPYGDAAQSYLNSLGIGDKLTKKMIYGNNLSITNQYIYTKGADIVITSMASKIALTESSAQYWYAIESTEELIQSAGLLKPSDPASTAFYQFLFEDASLSILEAYGYLRL